MNNHLEIGQRVTLKTTTISPITARVTELGNTYAVLKYDNSTYTRRVQLREAHHVIEGYYLYADQSNVKRPQ